MLVPNLKDLKNLIIVTSIGHVDKWARCKINSNIGALKAVGNVLSLFNLHFEPSFNQQSMPLSIISIYRDIGLRHVYLQQSLNTYLRETIQEDFDNPENSIKDYWLKMIETHCNSRVLLDLDV